jgi:hypothetical protein
MVMDPQKGSVLTQCVEMIPSWMIQGYMTIIKTKKSKIL